MTIPTIATYAMPQPAEFPKNKTAWQPETDRAVFLVHDMQRYFLRYYDADCDLVRNLIANLAAVKAWCAANGVPVVYTAQPHDQPASDRALLNDMWGPGLTKADPALQSVVAGLEPGDGDIVLTKWRYSAFQRSDLKAMMAEWGRDQLLIGGVYAHIGCMVTALDAFMNDIQPFLIGDALADFSRAEHEMALTYVATRCGALVDTAALVGAGEEKTLGDWLEARILSLIEDETDAIDETENLIMYGLDSIAVMTIAAELKARGVTVGFDELARIPTLAAWRELIDKKRTQSLAA
ncbi:MAG: isochorismatase family protein [Pseudomonadota bacterium]|nr:isochorismatase family protein [Pseudomonadota bacterium]